jgi:hypothetical protein
MNRSEREKRHRRVGFVPGLIFAWKIGCRGDWARLLVALLITSAGFAGASMVFRVRGGERADVGGHRESAQVVILRPDDVASRALLEWAREQSPFPDRWTPEPSGVLKEMLAEVEGDLRAASRYAPKLRPGRAYSSVAPVPGIFSLWSSSLPRPTGSLVPEVLPEIPNEVRVVVRPGEGLVSRWLPLEASWPGLEFYKLLGKEAKFVLGVDETGAVVFCLASEGVDPLLDFELQNWLRGHALKPAQDEGMQWFTVTVSVEAAELGSKAVGEGGSDD